MQYQLHLKIEITETLISSKKQKKMHIPYGELPLEEIKLIESIKKVIHIMGESIQLVCMQIILNQVEESYCQKTTVQSKISVSFVNWSNWCLNAMRLE